MQCSEFLNANKDWKQISVENTAVAAKKVLEDGDSAQAAVASETAGKIYGLKVLKSSINHNKNNTTRFIILSREPVYREDAGKISISFELPHKSGSLYNMLSNFIYNGVSMVMIESRPVLGKTWEYRFFIDIEGNLSDASIQNALKGIAEEGRSMRILGNY
jgi:chorismate mutase/prephenate dehydratase